MHTKKLPIVKKTWYAIYSLNNRDQNGYIKGSSALPSSTSSKPYPIACIRRIPESLFGKALLVHNHLSHKPPTFSLGILSYAGSPKTLRRYIPYIGAICGDSPHRNLLMMSDLAGRVWCTMIIPVMNNTRIINNDTGVDGLMTSTGTQEPSQRKNLSSGQAINLRSTDIPSSRVRGICSGYWAQTVQIHYGHVSINPLFNGSIPSRS
ncbi:hypothetical protein PIB30_092053 [Stylosanthes scabra]|uniref:Uncharacterized protein n=1 Tax=Stylosanthes scabra TaxID=79078 RepID=A0ABU6RVP4_9FABA|nr:hypothetical protein [Stylosanthes scabra]